MFCFLFNLHLKVARVSCNYSIERGNFVSAARKYLHQHLLVKNKIISHT